MMKATRRGPIGAFSRWIRVVSRGNDVRRWDERGKTMRTIVPEHSISHPSLSPKLAISSPDPSGPKPPPATVHVASDACGTTPNVCLSDPLRCAARIARLRSPARAGRCAPLLHYITPALTLPHRLPLPDFHHDDEEQEQADSSGSLSREETA